MRPALRLKPEVTSLNIGFMNFGLFPILDRYKNLKHAWERSYLKVTRDLVFKNTFADIEFECYDTAHRYNLAYLLDRKLATPPLFLQTVFGILVGIGTHPDDAAHLRRMADRLFGKDYIWSVLGAGRAQMPIAATVAAAQGGNVRVGFEDSLWEDPGQLARSNADQVWQARKMVEVIGLDTATPNEARAMLQLKGRNEVGFWYCV